MKKEFNIFGIHANPSKYLGVFLAIIPFVLILMSYHFYSTYRTDLQLENNKVEKITPTYGKIYDAAKDYTFNKKEDVFRPFRNQETLRKEIKVDRKECVKEMVSSDNVSKKEAKKICKSELHSTSRLLKDIQSSLFRIICGVLLAASVGFLIGLNMGIFKGLDVTLSPLVTFLSIIPPLSLLPMFMITLGTGEAVKISLIFVGLLFFFIRDMYREAKYFPVEMLTKALTLGATQLEITYKIVAPLIFPALINTIRLNLGAAWLFLIAGEAMSATSGLGYTIFLVKRYMAMDVIIFYVLVITVSGFLLDRLLVAINNKFFPWYEASKGGK